MVCSGNSGTDPLWGTPSLGKMILATRGYTPSVVKSTVPGSSLSYRRIIGATAPITPADAWRDIASYGVLQITDNSKLDDLVDHEELRYWADRAWALGAGGAGAEILVWMPQPSYGRTTGLAAAFPDHLAWIAELKRHYRAAVDYCNVRMPLGKKPIRIIPGLWVFEQFYKDQVAGVAPTATWYDDLHVDDFHMQANMGSYIVSALHAACLFGVDPAVIPATVNGYTCSDAAYVKGTIRNVLMGTDAADVAGLDVSLWS